MKMGPFIAEVVRYFSRAINWFMNAENVALHGLFYPVK
jgi:hypothetical protein